MERYDVYYDQVLIGRLQVDTERNLYCYEQEASGVEKVKDRACLQRVMTEGSGGFTEPIPFFQNRIMNMKRAGLSVVNYQTDKFTLVLLQDRLLS